MSRIRGASPLLLLAALAAGGAGADDHVDSGDPDTPVWHTELMHDAVEPAGAPSSASGEGRSTPRGEPAGAGLVGEFYAGIVGGNVEAADTSVSGTYQCYFCSPVSDQASTSLSGGGTFGFRAGFWSTRGAVNPGIAFEASGGGISGDRVSMHYQGFGFAPMLRLPLWRSAGHPQGRLAPYAGLLLYRLQGGSLDVSLPALPRPLSGTPTGLAKGLLLGVSARLGAVDIAAEARKFDVDVTMDSMAGDDASFRVNATQMLLVISYVFH